MCRHTRQRKAKASRPAARSRKRSNARSGRSPYFIVLNANPLDDIANTRKINKVYLRGQDYPRAAMRAKWQAGPDRMPGTQ